MDLEAAGGMGGRKVVQHGSQAPLLSPERRILMEEEVITPRLLMAVDSPAPIPEVPPAEKLLHHLVAETQG